VKSLVPFKSVLDNMNVKLDWTQQLGDAFLAQQKDVMDAIQRLRQRAQTAGNLSSNDKQTVTTETQTDPQTQTQTQTIIIQPANPQVVYVPTYQPTVVYGAWPYPYYPPYAYPAPPGAYFAAGFFWGAAIGASAAYWGWGNCGWHDGDITVKHKYESNNNRNNNNNRDGKWNHNVDHRKGVNYRNASTRDKYGRGTSGDAAKRQDFRGREGAGNRPSTGTRPAGGGQRPEARTGSAGDRASSTGQRGNMSSSG